MQEITSRQDYTDAIRSGVSVVVFSADWCPDCRFIEPVLPEIEQKYQRIKFFHVNRDNMLDLCQELNIFGIPSFILYKDGTEVDRFVSKDRKTQAEIEAFIEQAMVRT